MNRGGKNSGKTQKGETMKSIFRFLSIFIIALFFSTSAYADKVYSSGSGVTAKTYKERGFVSVIINPFFQYIASLGMVADVSTDIVYGETTDATDDVEDIWGGGGSLTYAGDGSADAVSIASSSGSDTDHNIFIVGLDISGDEVVQTIALNGTTRVALTTGLWRVQSMENDSSTDLTGNVFIYSGVSTVPSLLDTEIRGVILAANERSLMSFYTVPNDMVGMLVRAQTGIKGYVFSDPTGDVDSNLEIRKLGKVFKRANGANLSFPNDKVYQDPKNVPIIIPGLSDIKFTVGSATVTGIGVYGSYEIITFPESGFETEFLRGIDQPGF